jgi:DNA-binding IclR family transcriptional regulator
MATAEETRWPELAPRIMQALEEFRESGYVLSKRVMNDEVNKVGVPVLAQDGSAPLALAAGGLAPIFDDAKLIALASDLKQLAARLAPAASALR